MLAWVADGRLEMSMAISSRFSAVLASPSEKAARYLRKSLSIKANGPSISRARCRMEVTSSSVSCFRVKVRHRERRVLWTLKEGFSDMAPIKVI